MPRLFTAIEIPTSVAQSLSLVKGGLAGARWIDTENYHITIRFIGDVDLNTAEEIALSLGQIKRDCIDITVNSLDIFGGNKPRVLFARVEQSDGLDNLRREQESIFRKLSIGADSRKFSPHVTLARFRQTKPEQVARFLGAKGSFFTQSFTAKRFVLMSSKDSTGGGPYIVEEAYDLNC